MKELKSHPDLLLRDHIAQVKDAMEGIWKWHSGKVVSEKTSWLSFELALLHDVGKASTFFQAYIVDPPSFNGDPLEKAHTPLSLLVTLLYGEEKCLDPLDVLLLAACVYGHHSGLPRVPGKNFGENQWMSRSLDDFSAGRIGKVLRKQVLSLNLELLKKEINIDLECSAISQKDILRAEIFLENKIFPVFYSLNLKDAVEFRLKTQFIFSVLLEADKTFLAIPDAKRLLRRVPKTWRSEWIEMKIAKYKEKSPVNLLRKRARHDLIDTVASDRESRIYTMTAPTGIGKTLLGATWAFMKREAIQRETGNVSKIIIVMPYLSIIEQTAKEYESLLRVGGQQPDGAWILQSHSLAERKYDPTLEDSAEYFFIDTWRTELVITTYDQFLLSLIDSRSRYQMRFHNLCDALIVMDEVQSLPCKLWKLLESVLCTLTEVGNSQILLMSATLPSFVPEAKPILKNYGEYFRSFSRYELHLKMKKKIQISDFCDDLECRLEEWLEKGKRVLITLNTRRSARIVYDHLKDCWPTFYKDIPLLFLSADVTPKDRLKKIDVIKRNQPCIVVSTQCIEAGVDIDMGVVIRDFAPWDSIVQIAGRCNREGKQGKWLPVEIVDLVDEHNQRYSSMIYDDVSLCVTRNLLELNKSVIKEEDTLEISNNYFKQLEKLKNTGMEHLERFARWQDDTSVRELLRGKDRKQYSFLVIDQDPSLLKAMKEANEIQDRWKRREAWRKLAGRIAQISVAVWARPGFSPEEIASEYLGHWILREGYYDPERGIRLEMGSTYQGDKTFVI